jgi:hypothetical protein
MEISKVSYDLLLKGRMVHWGTAVVKRAINFLMECSTKLVLAGEMRKGNDRVEHSFTLKNCQSSVKVLITAHPHLILIHRTP